MYSIQLAVIVYGALSMIYFYTHIVCALHAAVSDPASALDRAVAFLAVFEVQFPVVPDEADRVWTVLLAEKEAVAFLVALAFDYTAHRQRTRAKAYFQKVFFSSCHL